MRAALTLCAAAILTLTVVAVPTCADAQAATELGAVPRFQLELSVIDAPFNGENGIPTFPSMEQSLQLSNDFYRLAHWGVLSAWGNGSTTRRTLGGLTITLFDFISMTLPGGMGWLHEEWHRAVMSRREISSYNDIYNLELGAEVIAVSQVSDRKLAQLKAQHPAEFVRLAAAGMEAQIEQNATIERDNFFGGSRLFIEPLLVLNFFSISSYLGACSSKDANDVTDRANEQDGRNVPKRDFTGLDCDAWVYDLHRPREAYAERGEHPSGVGIDRYIRHADLTRDEKHFLRLQYYLSHLNFVDPQIVGFRHFRLPDPLSTGDLFINANVRHYLTSFGYALDLNVLAQRAPYNMALIAHSYFNRDAYRPGLELMLERLPFSIGRRVIYLSPRLLFWLQPRNQDFYTRAVTPGVLARLKASYPIVPWFELFASVEGKTEGWVAGNVYLDANLSARMGASFVVY